MYERLTELHLNAAQYRIYVEKRCKRNGKWALGTMAFILFELDENVPGILQLDVNAVLRCQYLIELIAAQFSHRLDDQCRTDIREIMDMAARVLTEKIQQGHPLGKGDLRAISDASQKVNEDLCKI